MAFTDPIIAGEELTRMALKSDNYIPGVSGWRIARDGAAEFDNLGIRGNLWVPSITLGGEDLATKLAKYPRGIIGWMYGYPTTSTTTQAQIMAMEVDVIAGRWYEISAVGFTPDMGNTKGTEFHLRRTIDGSAVTNSSYLVAMTLRLSQFEMGSLKAYFQSPFTGRLKLRTSIVSLDGATVRVWCPGDGMFMAVHDFGVGVPPAGQAGTGVPVRVIKEWTITAASSRTYLGTGALRTDANYSQTMIMGDWSNGKGNQRGWCSFSASDNANYLDDLVGVPAVDIITAELKLRAIGTWKNGLNNGLVSLGFHNFIGNIPASSEPGGGIPNVCRYTLNGYDPFWFDLKTGGGGGGVPSNYLDSFRDGYLNGFMVGNTFSGNDYCGILAGASYPDPTYNTPPQLHMKYWKTVPG